VGDSSGETHRLGDPVSVRLVEAAPVAGALRFELLSGSPGGAGNGRARPSHPMQRGKPRRKDTQSRGGGGDERRPARKRR
jgi:ribonuclease R